jgi:hypothetical protein
MLNRTVSIECEPHSVVRLMIGSGRTGLSTRGKFAAEIPLTVFGLYSTFSSRVLLKLAVLTLSRAQVSRKGRRT